MKYVVIVFLALVFSACDKQNPPQTNVTEEPVLSITDSWKAANRLVYDYMANGVKQDSMVIEIESTNADGSYNVRTKVSGSNSLSVYFMDGDSLKSYPTGQSKSDALISHVFNAKVGVSWQNEEANPPTKYEVLNSGSDLQTLAGIFPSIKLGLSSTNGGTATIWMHPAGFMLRNDITPENYFILRSKNF